MSILRLLIVVLCALLAACSADAPSSAPPARSPEPVESATARAAAPAPTEVAPDATQAARASQERRSAARPRPSWLGTRVLPRAASGYGEVRPTPNVLRNRRLGTRDLLPPPTSPRFTSDIRRVPDSVVKRSTWSPKCPVSRDELRYVTVSFHGFDGVAHTGELLVHADVAGDVVSVFRHLHRQRFPIEEMRVVRRRELTLPPTGDGNNTTSFVCRPSRGSTSWSEHAYGLAIDINPFHNPYIEDEVVLPELASAYRNRSWRRPGMHHADSASVRAFARIGWEWGGNWSNPKDPMHFSRNGR